MASMAAAKMHGGYSAINGIVMLMAASERIGENIGGVAAKYRSASAAAAMAAMRNGS